MKQALECYWRSSWRGNTSTGDLHPGNLRVSPVYDQNSNMVDVKVELVGDFDAMMPPTIKKHFDREAIIAAIIAIILYLKPMHFHRFPVSSFFCWFPFGIFFDRNINDI